MTLRQLKKKHPLAYGAWMRDNTLTEHQHFLTTRAYEVNRALFIVWNNGCFYEAFRFVPPSQGGSWWRSLATKGSRAWRAKYYSRACKTLSRLDRAGIYG